MQAWVNGQLLADPTAPALPVTDHGFTVGDGVFEAVKIVRRAALRADAPPASGSRSSARGSDCPTPTWGASAPASTRSWPRSTCRSGGCGSPTPAARRRSARAAGTPSATLVVVAAPLTAWEGPATGHRRCRGHATSGGRSPASRRRRTPRTWSRWRTRRRWGRGRRSSPTPRGDLCEGTGSNVFYVVDGELRTPTLRSGCLAGITRALLLEWCDVVEVDEPVGVLARADEIFLASTTRDVQAVAWCDGRELARRDRSPPRRRRGGPSARRPTSTPEGRDDLRGRRSHRTPTAARSGTR